MQKGIRRGEAIIKYFELFDLSIDETLVNYAYGNNFDCFYIIFIFLKSIFERFNLLRAKSSGFASLNIIEKTV